jgi:hypothetical protein
VLATSKLPTLPGLEQRGREIIGRVDAPQPPENSGGFILGLMNKSSAKVHGAQAAPQFQPIEFL